MTITFAIAIAACDPSDPSPCEPGETDTSTTSGESSESTDAASETETGTSDTGTSDTGAGFACCSCAVPPVCEIWRDDPSGCEASDRVWCQLDQDGEASACFAQCA